jgi:hypothetical protein
LSILAVALTGCAHYPPAAQSSVPVIPTKTIDKGCDWVKFITASADDTPETKRQIIAHDQAFLANCPASRTGAQH